MWTRPQPLISAPPDEVSLPEAPLVRVISQVRFPTILAIRNPDKAAVFQEMLRDSYPNLIEDRTQSVDLSRGQTPSVSEEFVWRLTSKGLNPQWRVSLGVDFVALETSDYISRTDFLDRFDKVVRSLHVTFRPTDINRLGLRYIDRITDDAIHRIGDLIHPNVLGILRPSNDTIQLLGSAAIHVLTEARFVAMEGHIQARWGKVPENVTYDPITLAPISKPSWVLDLDMFTPQPETFDCLKLTQKTHSFAKRIYAVFREVVTDDFLRHFGGVPCHG